MNQNVIKRWLEIPKAFGTLAICLMLFSNLGMAHIMDRTNDTAGFEIGNGHGGLDTGGFEIGNGREVIELLNKNGAHSIKFYKDFDFQIKGEHTWATGAIAGGKAKATIDLGIVREDNIPTLSEFLVSGLKKGLWSIVNIGGLQGLKRDTYDEKTNTYTVEIELHLNQGQLVVYKISSSLQGLKEIQAISNSIKVHIN